MFHYFEAITNTRGDALIGFYTRVIDTSTGDTISIYADESSTPIVSVSGVADAAQVDADGMVSFYVESGEYHLDIYATDSTTLVKRIENVPMSSTASEVAAAEAARDAAIAAAATVPGVLKSDTRSNMAALGVVDAGISLFLYEAGREGTFVFSTANLSTQVTADSTQGVYVAPSSDTTGASGAWVRKFSGAYHAAWWGVVADNSTNNATTAQAAINAVYALGGGELRFPAGITRHSGLTFKNKIQYRGHGRDALSAKGTVLYYTGTGDGVVISNPINSSTIANVSVEGIAFTNATRTAGKGCFADTGSTDLKIRHCSFTGADHGLILDQSELVDVVECDFEANAASSTSCIWLVNLALRTPGASGQFTNRISIQGCQINGVATASGILDDGGYCHSFINNNYNGCLYHVRAAGVEGLQIIGGEWESSAGACLRLESLASDGVTSIGACTGASVLGGFMVPAAGQAAILVQSGSLQVDGGWQCSTTVAAIQGSGNISELSIGWASQRGVGAMADGNAVYFTRIPFKLASASPATLGFTTHFRAGDTFWNNAPTAGSVLGWRCTVSGNPGTWETLTSALSSSGGIGYTTGAGGTVTQATSKSTGVTLNKLSGQVTMNGAALAAAAKVSFVVTNSNVAATDMVIANVVSGGTASAYRAAVTAVASGSFTITVENITAGSLSEAPVIGFAVVKAVAA